MLQILKNLQNNKFFYFFSLAIFLSFNFVTDIKSLILLFVIYFVLILILFDFSIKEVLFLCIILALPFEKGIRGWSLSVIHPGNQWWIHGFSFYYGISIRTLLTVTAFFLYLPELFLYFKKNKTFNTKFLFWLVNIFVVLSLISTYLSSDYFLSFFGFLRIIQSVLLLYISTIFFSKKENIKAFGLVLSALVISSGLLAFLQHNNQGPLGLFLEDALGRGNGFFTSDGERLFRASGFIGHPTFFASFISMISAVVIGNLISAILKFEEKKYYFYIYLLSTVCAVIALYTTYSRSSWFALLSFLIIFFIIFLYKDIKKIQIIKKNPLYFLMGFIPLILLLKNFLPRFISSIDFFSTGSGIIRISLIKESIKMIKQFPLFGSGLNLSTRLMVEQSILPKNLLGFIYPVHNTFFLFLSELGITAGLIFIFILIFVLVSSFKKVKKNYMFLGVWLGVVGFILNAQVHTLFNQDPSFDLLFIFIGLLVQIWQIKK